MVHVRNAVLTQGNGFRWSLSDKPSASDSEWYVEDVAGWYGGSGVRGDVTARLGHGDFVERGYREGRVLTLHGTVVCASSDIRDWQERNLSGMAGDGDWCEVTCDDGNAELSTRVRLDGAPQIVKLGTQALRFQVPLRTEMPFLYSAWRESTLRPIGAGVGLEFPPFARDLGQGPVVTFGTAVSTDEWVWNDGNADSWPVFDVVADAPGGFAVGLGDKRVTYPWPTFPDIPVSVDMAGAVTVAGVDQSHLLGERGWASVAPQSMESPSFEFLQGGNGWATVRHRDTYI